MSSYFQIFFIIEYYTDIQKIVCCDMFKQDRKTFQLRERIRNSDEATGWTLRRSNSGRGKVFSLFSKMTRPAVGLCQPPIHWVTGTISRV